MNNQINAFSDIIVTNNIETFEEAKRCISLWDVNNGITYCGKCHIKNDSKIGNRRK